MAKSLSYSTYIFRRVLKHIPLNFWVWLTIRSEQGLPTLKNNEQIGLKMWQYFREGASTLIFAYSTHTGLCFNFLTKIILNNLNYQIVFDVENIRIFHSHSNIWYLQSIVKKIPIYESFFVHYALGLIATSLRTSFVLLLGLWSVGPFWSVFYYYFTVSFSSLFLGGIKSHSKGNKIIHTGVEIYYNIAKYLFVLIQNWFLNRFCNFSMLRNSQ